MQPLRSLAGSSALVVCSALGAAPVLAQGLSVQITSPADGATVAGSVTIAGTSSGLISGKVSVSVDGGPFGLASGTDNWSFGWDTTGVPDGAHTITARARDCMSCPAVTDSISVTVDNGAGGLAVTILSPAEGAIVLDTLTVTGTSSGAVAVTLKVDGANPTLANGISPWNVILEEGSLTPGPHTLTAEATDGVVVASDSVNVTVGDPPLGQQTFTYVSSVDGVAMTSKLSWCTSWCPVTREARSLRRFERRARPGTAGLPSRAARRSWGVLRRKLVRRSG